jgi:limonene-1,2-epoxide hydrolase
MPDPTEMYRAYFNAFQTLDPRAVLPYFHVPGMLLSPRGVSVITTDAELEAMWARVMNDLRRRDYGRSTLTDLRVEPLSDTIALLSVRVTRYRTHGTELERIGVTYTLLRVGEAWKIVLTTIHDPDPVGTE